MNNMLFDPIKIGSLTLKNRIVMAPMGTTTDVTNSFNMRDVKYYGERAKGGCGLVLTGAVVASTEFEPAPCQKLTNTKDVYMLQLVAERVHFYGAKFGIQLSPGIGRMNWIDPHTPPYSSSPIPNYYVPSMMCREIPTDGVKRLVKAMGESAKLAKGAGVDMIELHGYGGYLIDQFTSAKWNHRTDEYGGSFENRQRFLKEIVEEVRSACGKDFPIAIKMTIDSLDDERPIEEGMAIAKYLADSGLVDMIHFGRGSYSCRWRMVSSVYQPVGFDLEAAPMMKELCGKVPIMAHGKLNHPDVAEQAIKDGIIDLVAIGHGLIADPHWANKVKKGKLDDINPCIGCGECHFNAMKGHSRPCAVNVHGMREGEFELTPAKSDLKIMVIGGGPGGLKAAATAAERGYKVSLYEKNTYLGGAMAAAAAPSFKQDVKDQVEYLKRQLVKFGVDVNLNTTIDIEDVKRENPDYVVVATGANPFIIPVPGHDNKKVVRAAIPVLMGKEKVGNKVVIVGGGAVGCELATELCIQGKDVTIVELMDKILPVAEHFVANDQNIRYLVETSGAKILTSAKLTEIFDDGMTYTTKEGKLEKIECDNVIFATGYRANHDLYTEILRAGFECAQIGDNVKPGKIISAIHQGYHCIRVLEEE